MSLDEYRRKRNFERTAEPSGREQARRGAQYVIQKHAASRLHYDFRLELDGVLKSWAVPKGPSLDQNVKSLAVQVEDHPLEYGTFEGVIPKGQYGGGTVMIWDQGTWEPKGDPIEGYRRGKLVFQLFGERLKGRWALIRMGGKAGDGGKNWLLKKLDDEYAAVRSDNILARTNTSVVSGRTIEQIARGENAGKTPRQNSNRSPASRKSERPDQRIKAARNHIAVDLASLEGARRSSMPDTISPELPILVRQIPNGEDWLQELKLDGYRMICFIREGKASLITRGGNDWTDRFPSIVSATEELGIDDTILDGEIVAIAPDGTSDFQSLQNILRRGNDSQLVYFVFDLLYSRGFDLRSVSLVDRKDVLSQLLSHRTHPRAIRYDDHISGQGDEVFAHACRHGLEGIVAKRAGSHYTGRRSGDWVKVKCLKRQEADLVAGVRLTHPDRVLFPEVNITKRELAGYYAAVQTFILPHLIGRPLSLVRCPDGAGTTCFFQRHLSETMPRSVRGIAVHERGADATYIAIDDLDGLITLVQMGVLEIHPWGSREDRLDRPDRLIIDLDPAEDVSWVQVVQAARHVRKRLDELGLESFVRTTGGRGLHVVVPLVRHSSWDELKAFARSFADALVSKDPTRFIATSSKARRPGKIFIDYLRNEQGATAVASYSTRARSGATVATPISWDELSSTLQAAQFNVRTVPARLRTLNHDPWERFFEVRQSLTQEMKARVNRF